MNAEVLSLLCRGVTTFVYVYVYVYKLGSDCMCMCSAGWSAHRQCAGRCGVHGKGSDGGTDALVLQDTGREGQAV